MRNSTQQANNREPICRNCIQGLKLLFTGATVTTCPDFLRKEGTGVRLILQTDRGDMAEAELQTFTSIMDALVRISVSITLILLWRLFQPRVFSNDPPFSRSFIQPSYIFDDT